MTNEELLSNLKTLIGVFPKDPSELVEVPLTSVDKETLIRAHQVLIFRETTIDDQSAAIDRLNNKIEGLERALDRSNQEREDMRMKTIECAYVNELLDKGQFALDMAHSAQVGEFTLLKIASRVIAEMRRRINPEGNIPF
jgi:CII-binding regulator of phage lambda lysogenization HflD